jgi:3-dehydroquinate dehydratase
MKITKEELTRMIVEELRTDPPVMVKGYGELRLSQVKRKLVDMLIEAAEEVMTEPASFTHLNSGVIQALHQALKDNDAV